MPREKKITCGWRKVSIFTLILIIFGLYGPTVYFSSINMSKNRATIIRKSVTEVEMDQEVPLLQKSKTNYFVESDWSSASYFYSIVSLLDNATIILSSFFDNSRFISDSIPTL